MKQTQTDKSASTDFAKFFYDLLVKILLGLAAATVTLIGFAFERKLAIYFLLNFFILTIGCILYRLIKRWIVFFLLDTAKEEQYSNTFNQFLMLFLRQKNKKELTKYSKLVKGDIGTKNFNKEINKIANRRIIPFYVGTYPALFWTATSQLIAFIVSVCFLGWVII